MVIWIIGLSGAGKSTLASAVVAHLRRVKNNIVLIDGDMVREVFGNDLGHTVEDRLTNAERICKLGKLLEDQGITVVCAILAAFPETRAWNRSHLNKYYEVFIDTPISDLIQRDPKAIYRKFKDGEIRNVVGMDIPFLRPDNSDLVIDNTQTRDTLLEFTEVIAAIAMENGC